MLVRDVMTIHPVSVRLGVDLRRVAEIISIAEVSDVMVVDHDSRFVGVLSEGDLVRALLPSFDEVLAAGGTLDDAFRFFVGLPAAACGPSTLWRSVTRSRPAPGRGRASRDDLGRRQIRRLPVVDGRLHGTVSRADVCRAVVYYA